MAWLVSDLLCPDLPQVAFATSKPLRLSVSLYAPVYFYLFPLFVCLSTTLSVLLFFAFVSYLFYVRFISSVRTFFYVLEFTLIPVLFILYALALSQLY